MANAIRPIGRLSLETQATIRSSAQITSLVEVVLELVHNALDAQANNIVVRLDLIKGYCSVLDNGIGIPQAEFLEDGGLGKLYYTSKTADPSSSSFGRYGRFLSTLAAVSILTITSKCTLSNTTNTLVLKGGHRVSMDLDIGDELENDVYRTKVVVHDLLGNHPVRVKHRFKRLQKHSELEKDFEQAKLRLLALILASSLPVDVRLQETTSKQSFTHKPGPAAYYDDFSLHAISSIISQAGYISQDASKWRSIFGQIAQISIRAAFYIDPLPSRRLQFISVDGQPLQNAALLDNINHLFEISNFGVVLATGASGGNDRSRRSLQHSATLRQSTQKQKGVDRWPMLYIRILFDTDQCDDINQCVNINSKVESYRDSILGLLQQMVNEYLMSQGLANEKVHSNTRHKSNKGVESISTPEKTKPDYAACSRVKSSNSAIVNDIMDGLPFSRLECIDSTLSKPVQSLSTSSNHGTRTNLFPKEQLSDGHMSWKDPQTGNLIALSPRTGAVLPTNKLRTMQQWVVGTRNTVPTHDLKVVAELLVSQNYLPSATELPVKIADHGPDSPCPEAHSLRFGTSGQCEAGPVITKTSLRNAKVLGQIDNKYILASVQVADGYLIIIDQHAADERIKVERLFRGICDDTSTTLQQSISFDVTDEEATLFKTRRQYFLSWNITLEIDKATVHVVTLPSLVAERGRVEPKLMIEILRETAWNEPDHVSSVRSDWSSNIANCPRGIVALLISRACRSAIMFNDPLPTRQCQALVDELARCTFPFQCAHGRPSMTILTKLARFENIGSVGSSFGQVWRTWIDTQ